MAVEKWSFAVKPLHFCWRYWCAKGHNSWRIQYFIFQMYKKYLIPKIKKINRNVKLSFKNYYHKKHFWLYIFSQTRYTWSYIYDIETRLLHVSLVWQRYLKKSWVTLLQKCGLRAFDRRLFNLKWLNITINYALNVR